MKNYFNSLPLREKINQIGQCTFLQKIEFKNGVQYLKSKKIVIVGCGAQGLHQGLNMRDSGLDISYSFRTASIERRSASFLKAIENNFNVGTYQDMIPSADLIINLTPDKQHTQVLTTIMPLIKKGSCLSYSHGFNIVEEGMQIRKDITVMMIAPKSPGTEVREAFKQGSGVPALIAVHENNNPEKKGWDYAKSYAVSIGSHRIGVLKSSFVAEVKSDLIGEQTVICGLLQTASILCFDKMIREGIDEGYAAKLVQHGWKSITRVMKQEGITRMMDRLPNLSKIKAFEIAKTLKEIMRPLFQKHMDDILSGTFSSMMMRDWKNGDEELISWRAAVKEHAFEKSPPTEDDILEQEYFDNGVLMVSFIKSGVELAFEVMTKAGIHPKSAYYESLFEIPMIAELISQRKLFQTNEVISDTAEYGGYLFDQACRPLISEYINTSLPKVIGKPFSKDNTQVDKDLLLHVNRAIQMHPIEIVGKEIRTYMDTMKNL